MKYSIILTTQFRKDLKLIKKQGKDLNKLNEIIEKLANETPLDEKYKEHNLKGKYEGCKECHIEPDWLLVYKYYEDVLVIAMTRTGSHSDLFKK